MGDAYTCDVCGDLNSGFPPESLWTPVEIDGQETWRKVGDVCSSCWSENFE